MNENKDKHVVYVVCIDCGEYDGYHSHSICAFAEKKDAKKYCQLVAREVAKELMKSERNFDKFGFNESIKNSLKNWYADEFPELYIKTLELII